MATPTLELDTVEDSSADFTTNSSIRVDRGFIAHDLDTSVEPYSLIPSVLGISGMPAFGTTHPNIPSIELTNIVITGLLPNAVRGRIVYSKPQYSIGSSYLLTRSSRVVQTTEKILPNGTAIRCGYDGGDYAGWIQDYVPIIVRRPVTVLIAEGIRTGSPDYPGADYVGYVNEGTFQSRATGSWLIEEFTTQWSKYEGKHTFRCVLAGNILGKTWDTFGILFNSLVGKHVEIDQGDVTTRLAMAYSYGIINSATSDVDGFVRVGAYPTVDFASIGL